MINLTANLLLPTGDSAYGIPSKAMYSRPLTVFVRYPSILPNGIVTVGTDVVSTSWNNVTEKNLWLIVRFVAFSASYHI